ncbi:ribokinase [Pedobacter sp.]
MKLSMDSTILVIGSSNTDMVVKTNRFPMPGETILGGDFLMNAGGKGANQAVAAARLGAKVKFICKTGADIFGREAVKSLEKEGIDTNHILVDDANPSGVALILVDDNAENMIVVAPGANANLTAVEMADLADEIDKASYVLMQLEIPLKTVIHVAKYAKDKGVRTVLNPAPACKLPSDIYQHISIITPNEKEASMLTGVDVVDENTARTAALKLYGKGVETVIITMGAKGALLLHDDEFTFVPASVVKAVDTTAAGDVFNGALVVALNEGKNYKEAVEFACEASGISVTRDGAQASAPYRKELKGQLASWALPIDFSK